jgi:hypothetical protein
MICKCKPYFSIFFLFPSGLNWYRMSRAHK